MSIHTHDICQILDRFSFDVTYNVTHSFILLRRVMRKHLFLSFQYFMLLKCSSNSLLISGTILIRVTALLHIILFKIANLMDRVTFMHTFLSLSTYNIIVYIHNDRKLYVIRYNFFNIPCFPDNIIKRSTVIYSQTYM